MRRYAVNSYFTVSKMNELHVPRVSEDQLQAPEQVPIIPEKRPARPESFSRAYKFVRLKSEQAIPAMVVARIGARRSGSSHSRPVVCL